MCVLDLDCWIVSQPRWRRFRAGSPSPPAVCKQSEQERQSAPGRIEGYPLSGFPPFPLQDREGENFGKGWGLLYHATCPHPRPRSPPQKKSDAIPHQQLMDVLSLSVWESDTLRLARRGPDYSRINAVAYCSGM